MVLQQVQSIRGEVDHGDIVGLADQTLRNRCADPSCAQNNDLQSSYLPLEISRFYSCLMQAAMSAVLPVCADPVPPLQE